MGDAYDAVGAAPMNQPPPGHLPPGQGPPPQGFPPQGPPPQGFPNPYAAPVAGDLHQLSAAQLYAQQPTHRRNGPLSALLLVGLLTSFVLPIAAGAGGPVAVGIASFIGGSPILAVCGIVLTGPVYNKALERPGVLTTWGAGN
ncbi:MAG: hypothetical protein AAF552_17190, partial [Pseudomonadota bacterium]